MSADSFEQFAEAVSAAGSTRAAVAGAPSFERITILGGGSDALMLAALFLAENVQVKLFSAYGGELDALHAGAGIAIRGAGPVGGYQVNQDGVPSIKTTAEIDNAVRDADVIFLTGPVHKQRTYAMVLADHIRDGQVLVLAPSRSLGAAEAAWALRVGGAKADFTIVEVQALPYWHARQGNQFHLSAAKPAAAATLPSNRLDVLEGLKKLLPNIVPVTSTVHSGFCDGSGLIEVPALVMGGPAVTSGQGPLPDEAEPLPENLTFRALIGPEHLNVMQQLANERTSVARKFGVRELPGLEGWLEIHAGAMKGDGARPVPSSVEAKAMLRCATVGSLVPLASAAKVAGVPVPATDAAIALASAILGADLSTAGRRLETVGIDSEHIEDARRVLDAIANGSR